MAESLRSFRKSSAIAVFSIALSACTAAEWNSIHRSHNLGDDDVSTLISDAKQRIVLTKTRGSQSGIDRIVCAEPSPDVAQAVTSSISAAFEKAGADSKGLSVNAAAKFGESVAQLGERMAVIQLIRDKMYRACEAYANGAVDKAAYTLMLARLDKTMVTLLSQEMAAGAFGRALAVANASPGGADPAVIDKLKKDVDAAIDGIDPKADEGSQNKQRTEAKAKLAALSGAYAAGGSGGASGSAGGAISSRPTSTDLATTGKTIHAIYRDYVDDDGTEPLVDACLIALSDIAVGADKALTSKVVETTADRVKIEAEVREAEAKKDNAENDLKTLELQLKSIEANPLAKFVLETQKEEVKTATENFESIKANLKEAEEKLKVAQQNEREAELAVRHHLINQTMNKSIFGAYCMQSVLNFGREGYVERRLVSEQGMRILEKTVENDKITEQLLSFDKNLKRMQTCVTELTKPDATNESKLKACKS